MHLTWGLVGGGGGGSAGGGGAGVVGVEEGYESNKGFGWWETSLRSFPVL